MEINIFSYIRDILFQKKNLYKHCAEEQLNFAPFMLQRWCSMYNEEITLILNETTNKWLTTSLNKQHLYKLLSAILPQQRYKKVAYIKKTSNSIKEDYDFESISKAAELSTREVKEAFTILKHIKND